MCLWYNWNMNRGRGFTLVELIVVIVVIAILATLTTFGILRFAADGRDSERSANANAIAEYLEKYYDQNGEYPSCTAITGTANTVTSNVLKGLDQSALLVPGAKAPVTNSIKCGATLSVSGEDFFEYIGDGSADCTGANSCLSFTLKYKKEADNQIAEINSRRVTDIATSGTIRDLRASNVSYRSLNLAWSPTQNIANYVVERATNESFTTGLVSTNAPSNSLSVTGLVEGTEYFFRVRPLGTTQQGQWSNTVNTTALALTVPDLNLTGATGTSASLSWTASENADSNTRYVVERATNAAFTAGLVVSAPTNTLTHTASPLTAGATYYFRVKAQTTTVTPTYQTAYSDTVSSTIRPNTPTGVTATTNSATQITVSWTAVSGVTDYIVRYGTTSSSFPSTTSATTGTSIAVTGLLQGQPYYFRVFARQSGTESNASSTVTATTTINTPGTYNMSSSVSGGSTLNGSSPVSCPSGTTANFTWRANGSTWVTGTQYRSVSYSLNFGQGVTIQVATRCQKGSVVSAWRWSSNSASYTRPGMNLSMGLGNDACAYGFCGREVNAWWNNVCGTGAPRIYSRQLSATANWIADSASSDNIRFKGASSPGVRVYYDINIGCTAGSSSILVISAYKCTGCS